MTPSFLVVRPCDDSASAQIGVWGQRLRDLLETGRVIDLAGSACRGGAAARALQPSVRSVAYFGHGTETTLIGHGEVQLDLDAFRQLGDGVIVAVACHAGFQLGPDVARLPNVDGFLGFDDEIGWPTGAPLTMALAFITGLQCLFADGHELDCAADQLRSNLDAACREYRGNGTSMGLSSGESRLGWLLAKSNRYSVVIHGNGSGRFF